MMYSRLTSLGLVMCAGRYGNKLTSKFGRQKAPAHSPICKHHEPNAYITRQRSYMIWYADSHTCNSVKLYSHWLPRIIFCSAAVCQAANACDTILYSLPECSLPHSTQLAGGQQQSENCRTSTTSGNIAKVHIHRNIMPVYISEA